MFKKFPDKQLYIDTGKIAVIDWFKRASLDKYPYSVSVFTGNHSHIVKDFETEEQAEKFADNLAAELNGGEIFTSEYLEQNTGNFVINGKKYRYSDVSALFEKDDVVFAVVGKELLEVFSAFGQFSAERFIEDFAPNCPELTEIKGTCIYIDKNCVKCACVGADNCVYVVVGDTLIEVGAASSFKSAVEYCDNLRSNYGF